MSKIALILLNVALSGAALMGVRLHPQIGGHPASAAGNAICYQVVLKQGPGMGVTELGLVNFGSQNAAIVQTGNVVACP